MERDEGEHNIRNVVLLKNPVLKTGPELRCPLLGTLIRCIQKQVTVLPKTMMVPHYIFPMTRI